MFTSASMAFGMQTPAITPTQHGQQTGPMPESRAKTMAITWRP